MKCACRLCDVQVSADSRWCFGCSLSCEQHVPASVLLTRPRWYGTMLALILVYVAFLMTPSAKSDVANERFSFMILGALIIVSGLPYILRDEQ